MSNTEPVPLETVCTYHAGDDIQILPARDVPLGGPRAMTVRRTLPQRKRSMVGAWCFVDSYGPDDVRRSGGMTVARHPHTGLATVSWLYAGQIDHLDSAGNSAVVRPGEMNLMLAGRGITHQELSTPRTTVLHGVQLWYALPESTRHGEHGFTHYVPEPVQGQGWSLRVFIGALAGAVSPVDTRTPGLLGAELTLEAGAAVELALDRGFEHALLTDCDDTSADGVGLPADHLAYFAPGRASLTVTNDGAAPARFLLLGGVPFGEQIVMWWNFVGRTHEEVVAYRAIYQHEIGLGPAPDVAILEAAGLTLDAPDRFGPYPDDQPQALPAPDLPNTRLRPRG